MSAPLYNGGLKGAIDAEGRPWIPDDGNWSLQGDKGQPAYRALLLVVNSMVRTGYRPVALRELYDDAINHEGVFLRNNLLSWRGPILSPGSTVEMILTGGNGPSPDPYWDPNAPKYMEWNSLDPSTLKPIIASTGILTVPESGNADNPPPKPPPNQITLESNEKEMVEIGYQLVEQWRGDGMTDIKIFGTMHYQVLRALLEKDMKKRAQIKMKIREILG